MSRAPAKTLPVALVPVALSAAVLAGALAQPASAAGSSTVYGSTVQFQSGERLRDTLARIEKVDGKLGSVRLFQDVPKPGVFADLADRKGIISFKLPPAAVLAGTYDAQFRAFFAAAPKDHTTWWSYYHEPDVAHSQGRLPDLQQYRDASTRVARLARAAGNAKLKNTVILVGYTANPASGYRVAQFMPAAGLADLVSWDNYNGWFQRNGLGYGDPAQMVRYDQTAAATVGLPFGVAEFGSTVMNKDGRPDVEGRARWITQFSRAAHSSGAVFVNYFDYHAPGSPNYRLEDVPSQRAYRAVVSDQNPF